MKPSLSGARSTRSRLRRCGSPWLLVSTCRPVILRHVTACWQTLWHRAVQERPEDLQTKLETFLRDNGIDFSYSKSTKFYNFVNKTLE